METRSDSACSTITWSNVREVCETKTLFLIYLGADIATVIPKRFFRNAGLIEAWKQDVTRNMGKPIISKGFVATFC